MSGSSPPIRFLALVIGGWLMIRAVFLGSEWLQLRSEHAPILAENVWLPRSHLASAARRRRFRSAAVAWHSSVRFLEISPRPFRIAASRQRPRRIDAHPAPSRLALRAPGRPSIASPPIADRPQIRAEPPFATAPFVPRPASGRWSGSAWLFARQGVNGALAPAVGTLGGSQVGARVLYRLNNDRARPLSLSGRLYASLDHLEEREAAFGVDWHPVRKLPIHILAERRQALGHAGRSAFSLLAYGGISEARIVGPVRLDAYAQAGAVGVKSSDLFADGSARLSAPLPIGHRVAAGAGLWGAAQPGVARLDVGPLVSLRLTRRISASAEWRFRIAGNARPASGPALTLGADF